MPSNVIATGQLSPSQMIYLLREVGFPEDKIPAMVAIGIAESSKDSNIDTVKSGLDVNKKKEYSIGLWQINYKVHKDGVLKDIGITSPEQLRDPLTNAKAALAVYNERASWDKDGFKAWTKYGNGKGEYRKYLPDMQALAIRTKPTMIPSRSRMETNILSGGGGMSKPISSRVPGGLDDIAKIPVAGKEYTLGAAQNLFNTGDAATKNEILSILKQYEPNINYRKKDTANTAWNKLVENYSLSNSITQKPFTTWLASEAEYKIDEAGIGDGTSVFLQPSITPKEQAYEDFNTFIRDAVGVDANPADAAQYYKELSKLEKSKVAKQVTTRSGTTTTQVATPGITKEDREILAAKFVDRYIDTAGVKNVGGIVGSNLASIRKLASDYNVSLSDADVRKYAIEGLSNKNSLEIAKTKIQNTAKVRYQNLGQYIDQGLTVKDIASQYINRMANVLEINPDTIKLDSRYIDNALSTLPTFTDFNKTLRGGPEWPFTLNAREEVSSIINKVKSDFQVA
jgi:hypothetical protein